MNRSALRALKLAIEKGLDISPEARKARAVEQGYMTPKKVQEIIKNHNPKVHVEPIDEDEASGVYKLYVDGVGKREGSKEFIQSYLDNFSDTFAPDSVQANGLKRPAYMRMFPSKYTNPEFDMNAPMIFYHGTAGDISSLNPNYLGRTTGASSANYGTFLSNLPEDANEYAAMAASRNPKEQRSLDIINKLNDEIRNATKHKELHSRHNMIDHGGDPNFLDNQDAYIERLLNRMRMVERGLGQDNYSSVYPVHVRSDNPMFVDKQRGTYGDITTNLAKAKDLGHDSVIFFDITDPNLDATHVVVFDPSRIRSINAMFDPDHINSRDLLASFGGTAVLGASVPQLQEEPEGYAGGGLVHSTNQMMQYPYD